MTSNRKKMRSRLLVAVLVCIGSLSAWGSDLVVRGDSAYVVGHYPEAMELYRQAMTEEGTSSQLLYNLGNACVKNGDPGSAVVYYLRALRLDPASDEIRNNLRYAELAVADRNRADLKGKQVSVEEDKASFIGRVHASITQNTASDTWAYAAAVCFVAFILAVAGYIFLKTVIVRKACFFGGIMLLICAVLFVVFGEMAASKATRTDEAVISAFKTRLASEPDTTSQPVSAPLNKGTKVKVLDVETGPTGKPIWYKVRRNSNYVGWVRASEIEVI